ncbi:MAG: hypothetical protein EPO64_08940 [Nitrospirae bacterium]|nr:MAG: hypothetical protein EPO64_08940 [Nitrospirota bacterium]
MRRLDLTGTSTIRLGKQGSLSAWLLTVALLVVCLLPACAVTGAPSRLGDYVGREAMREGMAVPPLPERGRRAGLVLIADATAPEAAPVLPDEALRQMAEQLQEQFSQVLPVTIEKIVAAEGIRTGGDAAQFRELGKQHGLDYLVVVVVSGIEQEYPITVFLGWVTHAQPGLRRDNWSLVEVALVDVQNGQVLLHAEGQAWATLDRPTAPGINQWYPVVWRRPLDPNWRWWPPTYEGAPHTLRIIAIHEAVKRLMLNLQEVKRQSGLAVVEK